jgi:transposase
VDFGTGARCKNHKGKPIKTNVFRAVLSHSRKGNSEAVTRMTVERFIQVLKNSFWRLGGVPKVVVFDNGSCAFENADWYNAELHPKIIDFL